MSCKQPRTISMTWWLKSSVVTINIICQHETYSRAGNIMQKTPTGEGTVPNLFSRTCIQLRTEYIVGSSRVGGSFKKPNFPGNKSAKFKMKVCKIFMGTSCILHHLLWGSLSFKILFITSNTDINGILLWISK